MTVETDIHIQFRNLDEVKIFIRTLFGKDEKINFKVVHWRAMLVMVVFVFVSQNEDEVLRFFNYQPLQHKNIRRLVKRIHEVGFYIDGKFNLEWLNNNYEHSAIAMTLDAMVLTGDVERVDKNGIPHFQLAGQNSDDRTKDIAM